MALADLARNPWAQQLYGPVNIPYTLNPMPWEGFAEQPAAATVEPITPGDSTGNTNTGDGGGRDSANDSGGVFDGRSTPQLNDPAYWGAGDWTPDIGWKDTVKAYGPAMGMGLTGIGGLAKAMGWLGKQFKNPTQDPVFQEAAQQYLDEFAPGTQLSQVMNDINLLLGLSPEARTYATDTARGVLMGYGPLGQVYDQTVNQLGLAPHAFAQTVQGMQFAGQNPFDQNAWSNFADVPGLDTLQSYGYTNKPQLSYQQKIYDDIGMGRLSADGPAAQAAARGVQREAQRAASREWMDDVLAGRTTDTFDSWSGNRSGDGGGYNGSNDSGRNDAEGHADDTGGGMNW